jgi:hypothetical protein
MCGRPFGQSLPVLFGNEAEIGVVGVVHVVMRRAGAGADVFQKFPEVARGILGDCLEHFFLGLEVVIERPRGEVGFPDDVAHRRRFEPDASEYAPASIQNRPAVRSF